MGRQTSPVQLTDGDLKSPIYVVGADVTRGKWVAVVLEDGRFDRAFLAPTVDDIHEQVPEAKVIAVDIPIGLSGGAGDWPRACDLAAREFVGPRRNSVFATPPRPVVDAASYEQANASHRSITGKGLSKQTWALRAKILEVENFMSRQPDTVVVEVHPEVSFCALNGGPLKHAKRTWNGETLRRRLLADVGIALLDDLPDEVSKIPHDDILDAAVAAWGARRFAAGEAEALGEPSLERDPRSGGLIWY